MTKSRNMRPPRKAWGQAELDLLKRNFADSTNVDLAAALGRRVTQIHAMATKLGLRKSPELIAEIAGKRQRAIVAAGKHKGFEKGHVPANKGLKRPGWAAGNMASTWFKKGGKPHSTLPVGSYRLNSDGYLELKIAEVPGPYYMRWKPVHRLIWEQAYGPVPKGHIVRFKPGRASTELEQITLDSIELLTHAQNLERNSVHRLPPEIVSLIQLRGTVNRQINRRSKKA